VGIKNYKVGSKWAETTLKTKIRAQSKTRIKFIAFRVTFTRVRPFQSGTAERLNYSASRLQFKKGLGHVRPPVRLRGS